MKNLPEILTPVESSAPLWTKRLKEDEKHFDFLYIFKQ